jgi:phage tail sheath protein FI
VEPAAPGRGSWPPRRKTVRTPVTEIRPPGIYSESGERTHTPIALGRSGIVGFVGLAQRGPTNEPVRISEIPQFYEVFGDLPDGGFLAPAVNAFFKNGGRECFVVRIAHQIGRSFGQAAARASLRLVDGAGQPTLLVEASSEGLWGNQISVTIRRQAPRAQTFLTLDGQVGDTDVTIRSTHGFRPGILVRIFNDQAEEYRFLTAVEGKSLGWSPGEPLKREFAVSAPTYVETVEFEIVATSPFRRETFQDLSMHPGSPSFVDRVVASRSSLITARALGSRSAMPLDIPAHIHDVHLTGGQDGLHNITPDDFIGMGGGPGERKGFAALELVEEVDLLAAPDVMWLFERNAGKDGMPFSTLKDVEVVHDAMIAQCERLKDRFAILDSPFPESPQRTRDYRLNFDTRFGALYFPWILVTHRGQRLRIPPCGHVAGIIARCDEAQGVHRPPANEEVEFVDDLGVLLRDEDLGYLNAEGINCFKAFTARGIRIWGARTMSSDPQYRFMNVRRIMNAINKAISTNTQWVVFEPNVPSLWKTVSRNVSSFLVELWRRGFFQGEKPEDAFYVKCDDETNPPEVRDAGQLVVEIGVAPVRPAEFLVLRLAQEMQGASEGT